jgi:hypothetical protein
MIQAVNYQISTGETSIVVSNAYKKIYQRCAKFAVKEKERTWLYEKARG